MSGLKAIDAKKRLAAPPLNDMPKRLRHLADRIEELGGNDDPDTSCIIVMVPSGAVLGFGESLTRAELVGSLTMAAHHMMTAE